MKRLLLPLILIGIGLIARAETPAVQLTVGDIDDRRTTG